MISPAASIFSDIDSLQLYAGIHLKAFGYFRLLSKRFPYAVYDQESRTSSHLAGARLPARSKERFGGGWRDFAKSKEVEQNFLVNICGLLRVGDGR